MIIFTVDGIRFETVPNEQNLFIFLYKPASFGAGLKVQ